MSVSHIAQFTARIGSVAVTPQGFGTPLILAYHTNFAGDVESYSGSPSDILSALVSAGFTAGTDVHECARVMLAQTAVPGTIKVGRLNTAPDQTVTFTPVRTTEGSVYTLEFELNGLTDTATYTVENGDGVGDIATALHTTINAFSNVTVTSTDNTGSFSVSPDTTGDVFRCKVTVDGRVGDHTLMDVADATTAPAGLADRLAAILAADSDWYYLMPTLCSDALGNIYADFCASNKKFGWLFTSDTDALEAATTTCLMSDIVGDSNDYAACVWDGKINGYASAAFIGDLASRTPGSVSPVNRVLRQVTTPTLTPTSYTNLNTKKYSAIRAVSSTLSGTVGGFVGGLNSKADVTRALSWLEARIAEAIANLLLSSDKIGFTEAGLAAIRGAIQPVVTLAISNGLFDPGDPDSETRPPPSIRMPSLASLTVNDKANGILRGVEVAGVYALSIDKVLGGNITVQF